MKIFCSGIGGIGLSAYAALQAEAGHQVSGSDKALSPLTDDLFARGSLRRVLGQPDEVVESAIERFWNAGRESKRFCVAQ